MFRFLSSKNGSSPQPKPIRDLVSPREADDVQKH